MSAVGDLHLAQQLYPLDDIDFGCHSDYSPIIHALGHAVVRADEDDYSGDSFVLYQDAERFGLLVFGWGSCSGCDALQACESHEEVATLLGNLRLAIKWGTGAEVVEILESINRDYDWYGRLSPWKRFRVAAIAYINGDPAAEEES